jgi:hypothetical protein
MHFSCRIDTGDDRRVSKEEFTADAIKPIIEKWVGSIDDWDAGEKERKKKTIKDKSLLSRY